MAEKNFGKKSKKTIQSLNEMTKEEFDKRMATGLADAKAGRGIPVGEAFKQLRQDLKIKEAVNG